MPIWKLHLCFVCPTDSQHYWSSFFCLAWPLENAFLFCQRMTSPFICRSDPLENHLSLSDGPRTRSVQTSTVGAPRPLTHKYILIFNLLLSIEYLFRLSQFYLGYRVNRLLVEIRWMQPDSFKVWEFISKRIDKYRRRQRSSAKYRKWNLNRVMITKFSFTIMEGKRKLCECHPRYNNSN